MNTVCIMCKKPCTLVQIGELFRFECNTCDYASCKSPKKYVEQAAVTQYWYPRSCYP